MLKKYLEEELKCESDALEKIKVKLAALPETVLAPTKGGFYYYVKDKDGKPGKRRYIHRDDFATLRLVTGVRYMKKKVELISHNLHVIKRSLEKLNDYDDTAILNALPKTYVSAIELVRSASSKEVIQSENPKWRKNLVIKTSTGVMVRTKGELALYETLIEMLSEFGIKVFYEKKLVLIHKELRSGSVKETKVDVYPDFTIVFPDDTEIYWELCGLFDGDDYRNTQYAKFCDYYDNGIYMPKNLIVTMESSDKPLDIQAIRHIIESQIIARL
jgi:hypothetical protein